MRSSVSALLVAFTAQLLHVSEESTWLDIVPIIDGNCVYEDKKVPVDQTIFLEKPCESLSCAPWNATHGYLEGSGCAKVLIQGTSCKLQRRNGKYPACCPTVECSTSTTPKAHRHT